MASRKLVGAACGVDFVTEDGAVLLLHRSGTITVGPAELDDWSQVWIAAHRQAEREQAARCLLSKRADGAHEWGFDGDDPYIVCAWCRELRDALSGRVIRAGRAAGLTGEQASRG